MKKKTAAGLAVIVVLAGVAGVIARNRTHTEFTVGICQFTQHESLDAATRGFKDALTEALGNQVSFDEQNAQGDYGTCTTAINGFVSKKVDLILANSTNALQTAATATSDIPILGTSITDYGAALQVEDFDGIAGGNISGTSDLAPLKEQAAMLQELFPGAEQVGLLYCSAESNSGYQVDVMQAELAKLGYDCRPYPFSDSNDISTVVMAAASACDVLYVPTDNTAAANAELIANICIPEGIPVVTGEKNTCRICGAATLSIDYYELGYETGEMAVRILTDEENISDMPIRYSKDVKKVYNGEICEELGIKVPEDYEPLEAE